MPIPARYKAPFETSGFYHIYNRSVAGIPLFANDRNKLYFLQKFSAYMSPLLHVYAWCLLPNHFHFLVAVKPEYEQLITDIEKEKLIQNETDIHTIISMRFKNFFIAYSLAYKKENDILTNVFAQKFKHSRVDKDVYFSQLIYYIHLNPLHHQVCKDWANYPWSSYQRIKNNLTSYTKAKEVLDWFGGTSAFEKYHLMQQERYLCDWDD